MLVFTTNVPPPQPTEPLVLLNFPILLPLLSPFGNLSFAQSKDLLALCFVCSVSLFLCMSEVIRYLSFFPFT